MRPILYEKSTTDFNNLGIGILTDCISCTVVEELNGKYECEFVYHISGKLYDDIIPDRIIKVKANETSSLQLFRIYRASKPLNGMVKFYAQHISYDLGMLVVKPFGDMLNTTATAALNAILNNTVYEHSFSAVSDIAGTKNIISAIPQSARKWLGDSEGSILDLFKGEYEFDNFTIRLKQNRGSDNGVRIAYRKNLTGLTADVDIQGVYTSIYPYAIDGAGVLHTLANQVIELTNSSSYGEKRTLTLDLSDEFENDEIITDSKLREKALNFATDNKLNEPIKNLKVNFVQLWQTEEYKSYQSLERIKMGDIVSIEYNELGVNSKLEVIETSYNVLEEKYEGIELGEKKTNISDNVVKLNGKIVEVEKSSKSYTQEAVEQATTKITGGSGGYVVIESNSSTGYPEEILIMDTADKSTAVNVIRINKNGIGFSTNGYNGPFSTAWTIDGKFNASWITTGILNADLLRTGTISDQTGTTSINLANGNVIIKQDGGGQIMINGNGLFALNVENRTVARLFVSMTGTGSLDVDTVYIGEGTIIGSDFFMLGGQGYVPRQITVDGNTYTVLATPA